MTISYGTGFEAGSPGIVAAADVGDAAFISTVAGAAFTGGFGMRLTRNAAANWVRFSYSSAPNEAWFSVYFTSRGSGKDARIEFEMSDGTTVGFRKEVGNEFFSAYIGETNVADGSADVNVVTPVLVQGHVLISDGSGTLTLTVSGATDISFSGDTKPSSSTAISYLRFYNETSIGDYLDFDNLTLSDSSAPGDIRYISKVPDSDNTATWTRSAGLDNYALVDEIPPSDADYVETSTNTNQDLYTMADYSLNNAISHIVQWVRGLSTPSGGEFKMQIESGVTTSEESTSGLGTSAEYVSRILETDPDTLDVWTTSGFNAALAGQEAVVSGETVRVTQHIIELAYNQNISIGLRPLEMDVDLESGSRVWVSGWNDGTLQLLRLTSTLSPSASFTFGSATEADVDNRTFYLAPYAPGFFGTASLNDIIYIYGRWNDGAVTHIEKSTDGGTTFVDIGDSATWLTGWVGAFFADSTTTMYAFVNGASRALYRTTDSGATWSSLSSLPFDVDAGGMSVHPDGRILISNRAAAAQMAAYAVAPNYSSWTNATDSFPVAGGGARAIIWIT